MSQSEKDVLVEAAHKEQQGFLKSTGAHPDDLSLASFLNSLGVQGLLEGVRKAVSVVTLVAATGLTLYFGFKFYQATRRR